MKQKQLWDGFFLWDHIQWTLQQAEPLVDPWIALAAIAATTTRIKIGPLVTPLPRRRPWKLAREAVSLDHLSSGGWYWVLASAATGARSSALLASQGMTNTMWRCSMEVWRSLLACGMVSH